MSASPGPSRSRGRRQHTEPRRHDALVHRTVFVAMIAGLGTVLALTLLTAIAEIASTATVAISAVAAMVTAAMGVFATYLHRRH